MSERVAVNHYQRAPADDRKIVERVMGDVETFESGIGPEFRDMCEQRYKQYRGFKKFRSAWEAAGPNDRDGVLYDAKKAWGANLHIPLSYRTIETMVPRSIAHRPNLLYLPRQEQWEDNVANVRMLIDAQQENIDIDLPFQAVMRSGRIYGLGVGKPYWRREFTKRRQVKRRLLRPGKYVVGPLKHECVFDDPDFIDWDVFDFMWDPMGSSLRGDGRCGWIGYRSWRSLGYCLAMINSGAWNTESARALVNESSAEDVLRSMGSGQKYSEVWAERMLASGFNSSHMQARGEHVHEVIEWHDGEQVFTVLDRQLLVQNAENPCVGEIPGTIYRPTPLQKQLVGIGDLEPLEHLQRELDTRRSQISDAITIALCAGFAYDDAYIDEEDLVYGPAAAIRVRNSGDIRNALMPLPRPEVPTSAFEHERTIRNDFDAVSGLSDALDPQQGQISTATEAQLVQASLGQRIALGSRRFEIEVVRPCARAFLRLNQRMIMRDRDPIRLPEDGYDPERAATEGRWKWFPIGPDAIRGEFEIIPEGGSMAAKNIPQERQEAAQVMQMYGNDPNIDRRRPLLYSLRKMGIKDPEGWLKQSDPPVPAAALQALQDMGIDPRVIALAVQRAQQQDPQLPVEQQGPDADQVEQLMAGGAPA